MHGMYGTLDVAREVQRTIKRAELSSFLCLLIRKAIGPPMVHVGSQGIIDGLWRGEMRYIGPRAKDANLWILIWEGLHRVHQEDILMQVEHVRAYRTEKDMQLMSLFEKFILEGNEKADELAKEGGTEEVCYW